MLGQMGQRVLIVGVIILGMVAVWQATMISNLRADLARTRTEAGDLRENVDLRARELVGSALEQRRQDIIRAGEWLHTYYQSQEGLQRPEGLWIAGHPDFEAIGAWLLDVYLRERLIGTGDVAARQKVMDAIRQSDEWRTKHPGQ